MEGDSGNGSDIEAEDVVANNTHNAVLVTLWTVASEWQREMYSLGDQIFQNKRRPARRNRIVERMQYICYLTQGRDSECISQLRLNKNCFDLLCAMLKNRGLLAHTRYITVEEAIADFVHTITHNVRNRTNSFRFGRSGETINCHFHRVLIAVAQLAPNIIKQAGINTQGIPYFQVLIISEENCHAHIFKTNIMFNDCNSLQECVGVIDGTHVPVHVPLATQGPFQNRKGTLSQNVMAACGFDVNFQYVHPSWEGSATNARVLRSSLAHAEPLQVQADMSQPKNVCFNASMDDELLALLQEQIELRERGNRGFKQDVYATIATKMNASNHGVDHITASTIINHCKVLKKNFARATELLNASGFGFDVATKRVVAEDDVWTAWLQVYTTHLSTRYPLIFTNYHCVNDIARKTYICNRSILMRCRGEERQLIMIS
ncbi:hypothetical protein AAC387_Pa02g1565 [Persea americana]